MKCESYDGFYLFIAKPFHRFKMPFLFVTEVGEGESTSFSEYFGGFRKLETALLSKRIEFQAKDFPEDFDLADFGLKIPDYFTESAKNHGTCDLQQELDEKLHKNSPERFLGLELEKIPEDFSQKMSYARMLVNKDFSMIIEKKTKSKSLKTFLEILNKLPNFSPVSF